MDLNRINLFVKVAETGSFTAAARVLDLPKSSVSRGVAALEYDLGVRLLQRTTRQLHLTDAGRAYFETVSRALSGLDEAASAVSQLQDEPKGTLRITAPTDLGVWLLAPLVEQYLRRYPTVRLDVVLAARNVDLVQEGFDLALRAGHLADNTLIARQVGMIRAGLFASADYVQRRGMPAGVADLISHECLIFRGLTTWELIGPVGVERVEMNGAVNADGYEFLYALLTQGCGIGLLPLFCIPKAHTDEDLIRVLPDHANTGVPLHVVYPSARFLPKRVMLFRDLLLEHLPQRLAKHATTD